VNDEQGSAQPDQSQPTAPVRVLIIEDNAGDSRLLTELLSESPSHLFQTRTAQRLSEALEMLARNSADVVLTDLSLPDSEGLNTFHRIHERAPHVPVIVLTGHDDEALALKTVEAGAQDYLVKGHVDSYLLTRAIRYSVKRAQMENELAEERNLLRNVINNLLESIYVKDSKGRYRLDNLAHMRSLGASRLEDVIGKTAFDFFPHDAAVRFQSDDQAVIRSGKPVVNRQEAIMDETGNKRWLSTTKVPLRNGDGKIIGLVGIGRDITERKSAEEQLASYNEELREKNSQLEDDLDMASEIQQAFLPQQFPTFPRGVAPEQSALKFYSKYLPTGAVGGDFFHILPLSDTKAGVFICDVMGHGVRAALVTAIQRALVEEMADLADNPGVFLSRINHALLSILRRTRTPMFASAFYLYLDVAAGELRFANAGHPKPLHVRRKAGLVEPLSEPNRRSGAALGVFDEMRYETHKARAEPGDLLLLFTDGLYEVEGPNSEYFDQERVLAAVRNRVQLPTHQLVEDLLDEVQAYSAKERFVDDVCLVGVDVDHLLLQDQSKGREMPPAFG
jgi:sigma-B regulation protein RsbU (phosphoserine phosphatase)